MAWWAIFSQTQLYFGPSFIVMTVVGNFNCSYFLRLTWQILGLNIECGGSVCWPNNKISQYTVRLQLYYFFQRGAMVCKYFSEACPEFFLSLFMPIKNELKIMIVIFKNLLTYPTLVVLSLITMLHIGLVSL